MALRKSAQVLQRAPAQSPLEAAGTYALVAEYSVESVLAVGDIIEMGALPANCILTAPPVLVVDDVDTGTTLALDCGLMSGTYLSALNDDNATARTCGAEFFAGSTIGQTGGMITSTVAAGMKLTPSNVDRSVGIKVATGAAGNVVGAKIRLSLTFTNAPVGI